MPQYADLFVRDTLTDTGFYPNDAATACFSPDIIVWGLDPVPDPQKFFADNYGTAWYNNIIAQRPNYIYCRSKNLASGARQGQLYLYYSPGGLLTDVANWRNNIIGTAIPNQNHIKLDARSAGEVVVGDTAFVWTEPADPTTHYCYVAQIVTADNPNPLPESFPSSEAYVRWVLDNPAIAWRNIDVVNTLGPPSYQVSIGLQNLDAAVRSYFVVAKCYNLPVGTTVTLVCAALGPEPPIDISQKTNKPAYWTLATETALPGNFLGTLTSVVDLPAGQSWGLGMKVSLEFYRIKDEADSPWMASQSRPMSYYGVDMIGAGGEPAAIRMGTYSILTDHGEDRR